jgi:hemoglobin
MSWGTGTILYNNFWRWAMLRRFVLPALLALVLTGCLEGSKPTDKQLPRVSGAEKLKMPRESLYERLGGEPAITQVVEDFVAIVIEDPKIKEEHREHFKRPSVKELKKKLVDQIGEATGGPQKYTGKNMKDAHKGMKISDADFDALAADVVKALDKNKVGEAEKKELLDILGKMRSDVVEVKSE